MTRLAASVSALAVAEVLKRSRERHRELSICGVMLFDGERLGLLLCGAPAQVEQALGHVLADPCQSRPVVLADLAQVPEWAATAWRSGWRSGWCEPDALAGLEAGPAVVSGERFNGAEASARAAKADADAVAPTGNPTDSTNSTNSTHANAVHRVDGIDGESVLLRWQALVAASDLL